MNTYLYRFKTKEEFIKEFGDNWHRIVEWNSLGNMDRYLGKPYKYNIKDLNINNILHNVYDEYRQEGWYINSLMLMKNEKIPNYNPKKIIK